MASFDKKQSGRIGEQVACQFLVKRGFRVLECNYRKPWGEIDIIAEKNGIVRFVEVKALTRRPGSSYNSKEANDYRPEEHAHPYKLRKVARTADMYMNARKDEREYQVDVIGVFLDPIKRTARCRLFEQVL